MQFFIPPHRIFGTLPRFDARRVTTHSALLFHLLTELQRNGPRAIFSCDTVSDVEKFFRTVMAPSTGKYEDSLDHTYWDRGAYSEMLRYAARSPRTVRYSAPVVALYFDAFTHCQYYDNEVSSEVLTQMIIASYWWWAERDGGHSASELKMTRKRIVGKLRNGYERSLSVDVPIKNVWRRGPLWDETLRMI